LLQKLPFGAHLSLGDSILKGFDDSIYLFSFVSKLILYVGALAKKCSIGIAKGQLDCAKPV